MSTFYQPFSLAAQTAFAGLDTAARQADLQRSIADVPGGFAKKTVSGKDYWYHQVKLANASLQQSYIGPDDEATRKLLAQHANPLAKVAQQQLLRMARAAIELGCVDIPVKHARVINRMKDYGFFSAGGVLVGTHVFWPIKICLACIGQAMPARLIWTLHMWGAMCRLHCPKI